MTYMGRQAHYYEDEKCDYCGKKGASDFMGDIICDKCASVQQQELEEQDLLPEPE